MWFCWVAVSPVCETHLVPKWQVLKSSFAFKNSLGVNGDFLPLSPLASSVMDFSPFFSGAHALFPQEDGVGNNPSAAAGRHALLAKHCSVKE